MNHQLCENGPQNKLGVDDSSWSGTVRPASPMMSRKQNPEGAIPARLKTLMTQHRETDRRIARAKKPLDPDSSSYADILDAVNAATLLSIESVQPQNPHAATNPSIRQAWIADSSSTHS